MSDPQKPEPAGDRPESGPGPTADQSATPSPAKTPATTEGKTPAVADSKTAGVAEGKTAGVAEAQAAAVAEGRTAAADKPGSPAAGEAAGGEVAPGGGPGKSGGPGKGGGPARAGRNRRPWLIVAAVGVALVVLAGLGYFAGLGPMNRLSTTRDLHSPAKLDGLDRITDPQIRSQLQLDKTRDDLVRINKGKEATVEAYGDQSGGRVFVVIGLRGRVDIDKYVQDSGATPEQVKTVGKSTCLSPANVPTQCYRGSNTLTVIVQAANEDISVDTVAPLAAEAYDQLK